MEKRKAIQIQLTKHGKLHSVEPIMAPFPLFIVDGDPIL
jgi:hypothetical protein